VTFIERVAAKHVSGFEVESQQLRHMGRHNALIGGATCANFLGKVAPRAGLVLLGVSAQRESASELGTARGANSCNVSSHGLLRSCVTGCFRATQIPMQTSRHRKELVCTNRARIETRGLSARSCVTCRRDDRCTATCDEWQGHPWNHKRVPGVYRALRLNLPRRTKRLRRATLVPARHAASVGPVRFAESPALALPASARRTASLETPFPR
jgi:hypothetical protein